MKKIYTSILLLFAGYVAQAQLYITNWDINDLSFPTANTGYCAGQTGTLRKTTDGGLTWKLIYTGYYEHLTKVYFPTENTGFVAGMYQNGSLIKTTDGGITWQTVIPDSSGVPPIRDISFYNATTGYMVTDNNLYKTTDGGITWKVQGSYGGGKQLHVISPAIMLIQSSNIIYRTIDSGKTWNQAFYYSDGFAFSNAMTGFAYNNSDYGYTTDGGATWSKVNNPPHSFTSVSFYDTQHGLGLDTGKTIYKTSDGGYSWTLLTSGDWYHMTRLQMTSLNNAVLIGGNATIAVTSDGGSTWKTISQASKTYSLPFNRSVHFVDNEVVYVTGQGNNVIKSMDAGVTWQTLVLGDSNYYDINTSFFLNRDTGYVGSDGGHILKTTDGGLTWSDYNLHSLSAVINAIYFVNYNTGVAVGNGGLLLKTTDAGNTWNKITMPVTVDLQDVSFNNESNGFIPIYLGLLTTTDTGNTWTNTSGVHAEEYYVDFPNADTGYIYGHDLYQTIDGGTTWSQAAYGAGGCSNTGMKFVNGTTAYMASCGNSGVYKTVDEGKTWSAPFAWDYSFGYFQGISASPDGKHVIVITQDGYVMASTDTTNSLIGIMELPGKNNQLKIVPNPLSDVAHIYFMYELKDATISVYNTVGQLVSNVIHVHGNIATLYKNNLKEGIYIFRVSDKGTEIGVGKLLVE